MLPYIAYMDPMGYPKSPHLPKSPKLTPPLPSFSIDVSHLRTASSWPLALQLFRQLSTVDLIAVSLAMKVCSRGRQWTLVLTLLEEMEMQQLEGLGMGKIYEHMGKWMLDDADPREKMYRWDWLARMRSFESREACMAMDADDF